ncbi:MAG: hypothetical protein IPK97_07480 [Ahniella sp.]|nr:hypothetical protein [Ahniella sp.]
MKKLKYLAGALLGLSSLAQAGDLVLNLGGSSTYRIPLSSSTNISISPVTGDVTARPLNTAGTSGDGWCPAGGGGGTAPSFTSNLSATIVSLPFGGGSTSLSWTVTGSPTPTCTNTGSSYPQGVTSVANWNSSLPLSSTGTTLSLTTSGTYTFAISCTNTGGTTNRQVSVTVADQGGNPSCVGHEPPAGMSQMNSFVNNASTRAAGNQEWASGTTLNTNRWKPDPVSPPNSVAPLRSVIGRFGYQTGDTALIPIPSSQYVAFEFNTAGAPSNRAGTVSWEQPGENAAPLFATISPCKGDPNPDEAKCKSVHNGAAGLGDVRATPEYMVSTDCRYHVLPQRVLP